MTLVFLKLGGSLITVKDSPRTPRPETLRRLMQEIAAARAARPNLRLLLGHGSGSFGHVAARKYGSCNGVHTPADWCGLAEVQAAAGQLNRLVIEAAGEASLPVFNFPPSASAICRDGIIQSMALQPVQTVMEKNLIPLVFGDVAIDEVRGGTIVSTEAVFTWLARHLRPELILLAGIEPGVLTHWPDGDIIPKITPDSRLSGIGGAQAADVTGGMAGKVQAMLNLTETMSGLEAVIFSGEEPGRVQAALTGQRVAGTIIRGRKTDSQVSPTSASN